MSGYTSIRNIAGNYAGPLKYCVSERFENINQLKEAKCPTIIIHGTRDQVIPVAHAHRNFEVCTMEKKHYVERPEMTHNEFDLYADVLDHVNEFFDGNDVVTEADPRIGAPSFKSLELLRTPPEEVKNIE